jgi:hypothetical protein
MREGLTLAESVEISRPDLLNISFGSVMRSSGDSGPPGSTGCTGCSRQVRHLKVGDGYSMVKGVATRRAAVIKQIIFCILCMHRNFYRNEIIHSRYNDAILDSRESTEKRNIYIFVRLYYKTKYNYMKTSFLRLGEGAYRCNLEKCPWIITWSPPTTNCLAWVSAGCTCSSLCKTLTLSFCRWSCTGELS